MAKEYSCVKKTKKGFETSLVALSAEHPINKITVKMLCEKAELSRNAFYFHYEDINDLIKTIEDNLVNEAQATLGRLTEIGFPKNVYATVEALIDLLYENKNVCIMLFDKVHSSSFEDRLSKLFCDFNYQYFVQYHGESKKTRFEFFYMFLSSGFYGLLRHWMENEEKMTKLELTALSYVLIKRLVMLENA